ncbi:AAA family ATPase [Variovorax boronicumulans]|uniref:AAA family ATPase n=1 Tax=Variovorax boronicumulans TaxID=436515 RepID=UPI00277E0607|nr:AAA family ATPase [Variovorax boronicumulans]MDQ0044922.1 putative ATPase [Variovorax boronicumulans]
MEILFKKGGQGGFPSSKNAAILHTDNWDDYSFKTLFTLSLIDENGIQHVLGNLKIGYFGQIESRTAERIEPTFNELSEEFFSLGQDPDYYKKIRELSETTRNSLLRSIRDVVFIPDLLAKAENEKVFSTSLARSISKSAISGQFRRVLEGGVVLTPFKFIYRHAGSESISPYNLEFEVEPDSKPSTNIHVLIGRNGVGKTTLLNNMVSSIVNVGVEPEKYGQFFSKSWHEEPIPEDYFGGVASVSFSAFDPFIPLPEQTDQEKGLTNFYIGLKKVAQAKDKREASPKSPEELEEDLISSLDACFSLSSKRARWHAAIKKLESDNNFEMMDLGRLITIDKEEALFHARTFRKKMSSGHMIVLLTITKLIETVEEKTLVLIDEPESHLHPPLLSAFVRALSDLLSNRNGVAIIATHSPVVVQEVPKSCVWKLDRINIESNAYRPAEETFGENVGTLTRDIFGLEVSKSGFHEVLQKAVQDGKSFNEIYSEYGGQLGFEAQAILRGLIAERSANAL